MIPPSSKRVFSSRAAPPLSLGTSRVLHVLLMLDRSASMSGQPFADALSAAADVGLELAKPENSNAFRIGLAAFAEASESLADFTPASSFAIPSGLAARGPNTNFIAALERARELVARFGGPESAAQRPTVVILTDGLHDRSLGDPMPAATALKSVANVVCVAFGDDADLGQLAVIASRPELCVRAKTGAELRAHFGAVARTLSGSRRDGVSLAASKADPFSSRRR